MSIISQIQRENRFVLNNKSVLKCESKFKQLQKTLHLDSKRYNRVSNSKRYKSVEKQH